MNEKIPLRSFRVDELKQSVNGATQSDQSKIVVAYRTLNPDNIFVGPPQVIRYEKVSGQIEQRRLPIGETDACAGAPDEVAFVDEFILVSISISPSAECTFVSKVGPPPDSLWIPRGTHRSRTHCADRGHDPFCSCSP
ncbi:MAG: hypothetical protein DMG60_20840 [Acidobacteria bacterium]|nr:MAG: hypothetical protein DMG60_20840 [Acidobacteriota bacterium]